MSEPPHLDGAVKKRSKSRNGCLTCKKKRLKCDETKPTCLNCQKKGRECGGYLTNFKWRFHYDEPKPRKRSSANDDALKQHLELAAISVTGKSTQDIQLETELISQGINPHGASRRSMSFLGKPSPPVVDPPVKRSASVASETPSDVDRLREEYSRIKNNLRGLESLADAAVDEMESQRKDEDVLTPNLSALISFAFPTELPSDSDFKLTELIDFPLSPVVQVIEPEDVFHKTEESPAPLPLVNVVRTSEHDQILHLYHTYTAPIMLIKNGHNENPWRELISSLTPRYPCLFNSIASMTLFHLAGNPNLAHQSATLRSRACMYMKKCIVELAKGLTKTLPSSQDPVLPADVALATCLSLSVSESWDTHTSSGIAHLKGAKSMIQRILSLLKKHTERLLSGSDAPDALKHQLVIVPDADWTHMAEQVSALRSKSKDPHNEVYVPQSLRFLFNNWIYFEVLAQMTTCQNYDDKGIDLVASITTLLHDSKKPSLDNSVHSSPSMSAKSESDLLPETFTGYFDSLGLHTKYVDPVLGCAHGLFATMGKVANLICKINKSRKAKEISSRNTLSVITQATKLKQELMDWRPNTAVQATQPIDEKARWDIPSCIATAECYRYGTLLFLHQAVPEVPSNTSHLLAEKIFVLLASIPIDSDTVVLHIFPLLVASCEAEPGEEREWCLSRWEILFERMWLGNIERALEVVKEVWKRKDEAADMRSHAADGDVSSQISGLMAAIGEAGPSSEVTIGSRFHWSAVMREWDWEVMLG